jgi:hypothetical protein
MLLATDLSVVIHRALEQSLNLFSRGLAEVP